MKATGTIAGMLLVAGAWLAGCAAAPRATQAAAEPAATAESVAIADLEAAFWICDYVATTHGVRATPIAACRYATESLKREKFGGSFAAMLAWWRDNKAAEHGRLERTSN